MEKTTLFEEAFKKSLAINNSQGLMGLKTQFHKDKSKELLPEQVHPNISKLPSVYHATFLDHANQIVKYGVDPGRAKGYGQGAGFYVFTDLQKAIRHAKDLFKGGIKKEDGSILQGNPVCVVVLQLQNLNADEWDIDYEVSMSLITKFLKKYTDEVNMYMGDYISDVYFSKYPKYNNKGIPKLFFIRDSFFSIHFSNEDGSHKPSPKYQITTLDENTDDAVILSKFMEKVKSHPKLGSIYNQFESQVMIKTLFKKKDVSAIKYTGNVDDNNKDLIVTGIIPFKELNPQPLMKV